MDCSMPGCPVLHYLLEFAQILSVELVMLSNHLILFYPLQTFLLSHNQNLFQWVDSSYQMKRIGALASASVLPMNIQSWFPLGLTGLMSLLSKGLSRVLQPHNSKESILWHSAFFMVQLSHPYVTIGKTMALTLQTSVSTVMSLLFNMLSRFVIAFLRKTKCLSISRLQSLSAVILEPKKNKVCYCFRCFSIYLPWSDGTRCHDLRFLNVEF